MTCKLKTLNYLYHNAYDHKTYYGIDLPRGDTTHKFVWPLNDVVILGHKKKINTLYLHLQKTYRHQARQGADLPCEAPTIKDTWPFDEVTSVRLRDNLKKDMFESVISGIKLNYK